MFLCVQFLGAVAQSYKVEADHPLVVMRHGEIADLNIAARRLGLVPGPAPARIRLVDAGVRIEAWEEGRYTDLRRALHAACAQITPHLQCLGPALFLLDVPKPQEAVSQLSLESDGIWAGVGKTPFAARVRLEARLGPVVRSRMTLFSGDIAEAPTSLLDLFIPSAGRALFKGGFPTLGALRGKHRAELTSWIGKEKAAAVMSLLYGRNTGFLPDPPLLDFVFSHPFPQATVEWGPVKEAVTGGTAWLASHLRAAGMAACGVDLLLGTEVGDKLVERKLLRPTAREERLLLIFLTMAREMQVSGPIEGVRLRVTAWEPLLQDQRGFFGGAFRQRTKPSMEVPHSRREERLAFHDPWRMRGETNRYGTNRQQSDRRSRS